MNVFLREPQNEISIGHRCSSFTSTRRITRLWDLTLRNGGPSDSPVLLPVSFIRNVTVITNSDQKIHAIDRPLPSGSCWQNNLFCTVPLKESTSPLCVLFLVEDQWHHTHSRKSETEEAYCGRLRDWPLSRTKNNKVCLAGSSERDTIIHNISNIFQIQTTHSFFKCIIPYVLDHIYFVHM